MNKIRRIKKSRRRLYKAERKKEIAVYRRKKAEEGFLWKSLFGKPR